MATQNGIYETSSGDLLRAGFSTLVAGAGETLRTDVPSPAKIRWSKKFAKFHRWNSSAWVEITQPTTDIRTASFTPKIGKTYFCDTNAAEGDIVVSNPTPNRMFDSYKIFLKTDHATRKLTVNGNWLIIANEWVDVVYDGSSWNNFTHLIAQKASVTRDAVQSIQDAAVDYIDFDAVKFDNASIATNGTTPIAVRRSGKFLLVASWTTKSLLDEGERCEIRVLSNGVTVRMSQHYSPATNLSVSSHVSVILEIASGDNARIQVFQNDGTAQNTQTTFGREPRLSITEILDV